MNWKHAANYVAKQYIDKVPRSMYFDDVRLQMDAKLWGEEYNRYNPPKKVRCIGVVCCITVLFPLGNVWNTRLRIFQSSIKVSRLPFICIVY